MAGNKQRKHHGERIVRYPQVGRDALKDTEIALVAELARTPEEAIENWREPLESPSRG